jgi:hypothetical protein
MNSTRRTAQILTTRATGGVMIARLSARNSLIFSWILILSIICSSSRANAQVAFPNLSILGKNFNYVTNLWKDSGTNILARQMSIDYTSTGVIYAFNCEYALDTNTFNLLKTAAQAEMKVPAKIESPNFCVWRSDERKITVSIEFAEEDKAVRLIVISVDRQIRGMAAPPPKTNSAGSQ